jgi:hypothetical protein
MEVGLLLGRHGPPGEGLQESFSEARGLLSSCVTLSMKLLCRCERAIALRVRAR